MPASVRGMDCESPRWSPHPARPKDHRSPADHGSSQTRARKNVGSASVNRGDCWTTCWFKDSIRLRLGTRTQLVRSVGLQPIAPCPALESRADCGSRNDGDLRRLRRGRPDLPPQHLLGVARFGAGGVFLLVCGPVSVRVLPEVRAEPSLVGHLPGIPDPASLGVDGCTEVQTSRLDRHGRKGRGRELPGRRTS